MKKPLSQQRKKTVDRFRIGLSRLTRSRFWSLGKNM